jgi:hypothetical protein
MVSGFVEYLFPVINRYCSTHPSTLPQGANGAAALTPPETCPQTAFQEISRVRAMPEAERVALVRSFSGYPTRRDGKVCS